MPFRFQAHYALLTYAQCGNLDPFHVNDHLGQLGAECIIGRENHSDGGIHLHAFVDFGRKFSSRNERVFDVDGCHPNVAPGRRTPEKMWDYATKDGDVVAGGLERPRGKGLSETGKAWSSIVLAETREEFFALVEELDPRSLCVNFPSLRCYADWRFRPDRIDYVSPPGVSFSTDQFPELDDWVQRTLVGYEGHGESLFFACLARRCGGPLRGGTPSLRGAPLPPHPSLARGRRYTSSARGPPGGLRLYSILFCNGITQC